MFMKTTKTNLKANRSRITNGTALLPGGVDHRSAWARRSRGLAVHQMANDKFS
jgi:hypothetical protein